MYPISGYSLKAVAIAACCLIVLAGERTLGQALRGEAAFGGWHDDKPGVRRLLTVQPAGDAWDTEELRADVLSFGPNGNDLKIVATGVAVANDGSLFVTEDGNGTIWRVSYHGSARSR
jgi:glucose/arabinose dehydrogenase